MITCKYILMVMLMSVIGAQAAVAAENADTISVGTLVTQSQVYDGKTAVVEGEAVGPLLREGRFVWVNVHDGDRAMGVWMRDSSAYAVTHTGNYTKHGDQLRVSGVFNRACVLHGGDSDIHAENVTRIRSGYRVAHPIPNGKKNLMAFWLLAALFSVIGGVVRER